MGVSRTKITRKESLAYLESNPCDSDSDSLPLLEHLANDEFACWNDHLTVLSPALQYRMAAARIQRGRADYEANDPGKG